MANDNDVTQSETEMTDVLKEAAKKAERQSAQRREKIVKGSHLTDGLLAKARESGLDLVEKSGFIKITGKSKGRAVYVAKKGGRADFSGFSLAGTAVLQVSEDEAKARHLGKVRGQLNFECSDEQVLEAYNEALVQLAASEEKTE
jgi:hypothetical protein